MKVVCINGSARKDGNTYQMLRMVCEELEKEGIATEIVNLSGKKLKGCIACMKCWEKKNRRCAVEKDDMNEVIGLLDAADGMLLGSPTYFANVSTELKAVIDRAGMVAKANGDMFARKAGAGVVAVRRGGGIEVFNAMNHFFLIGQMVVPGSSYWNLGRGLEKGDVQKDEEGIATMHTLGRNMAFVMKKLAG